MKKLLIPFFILICGLIYAQDIGLFYNLRHSSRDAQGKVHLRFSGSDQMQGSGYEAFYSVDGSWQAAEVSMLPANVMEALLPYEFGQRLRYRLRANGTYLGQSVGYLHPAYQDNDLFPMPVARQALMGSDPVGDSLMVYATHLDLTDSYIASTTNRLYRALANASGSFPTVQGISAFNVYISTIVNPLALTDTLAYAMVYSFNIPGVLSSGLYKIGMGEGLMPTFVRLGDIQSQVADGLLHLSCNWADLTADPDFGTWPNSTNSLIIADMTMKINLDLASMSPEFKVGDNGAIGFVEFRDLFYDVVANTLPVLKIEHYNPETGLVRLLYTDAEQDFPLDAKVYFNDDAGGFMDMFPTYNPDGRITFTENAGPNTTYYVSDNGIDYVDIGPVANADPLQNPVAVLGCQIPNPLSRHLQSVDIRLEGLQKAPLSLSIYNLKGQKVLELDSLLPVAENAVYTWNRAQYPSLSSGIYILRLDQAGKSSVKRFVINK